MPHFITHILHFIIPLLHFITPLLLGINFLLWLRVNDFESENKPFYAALYSTIISPSLVIILAMKEALPIYHIWIILFGLFIIPFFIGACKSIIYGPKPTFVQLVAQEEEQEINAAKQVQKKSRLLNRDMKRLIQKIRDTQYNLREPHKLSDKELQGYAVILHEISQQITFYQNRYQNQLEEVEACIHKYNSQRQVYLTTKTELENRLEKSDKPLAKFATFVVVFQNTLKKRQAVSRPKQKKATITKVNLQFEKETQALWARYNEEDFWSAYETRIRQVKQTLTRAYIKAT